HLCELPERLFIELRHPVGFSLHCRGTKRHAELTTLESGRAEEFEHRPRALAEHVGRDDGLLAMDDAGDLVERPPSRPGSAALIPGQGPQLKFPVLRRLTKLPRRCRRVRKHSNHELVPAADEILDGPPRVLDPLWQTVHQTLGKLVHESADKRAYKVLSHELPDCNRSRDELRQQRYRPEEEDERLR